MNSSLSKYNIENKTALITGAAGLLGIQHSKALLEIGAQVILTDLNETDLNTAKDFLLNEGFGENKISSLIMDVTSEKSIQDACEALQAQNIQVDILINNAAINPTASSIEENVRTTRLENFSVERWNKELSVGLTGAFLCSRVFGSLMAQNGGGVILNISSDLSVIAPDQRLYQQDNINEDLQAVKPVTYSVIKTGMIGLTRYLASYWPDKGVRSNALSPGGVYIDQDKVFVDKINKLIPLARMANPDEYNSAVQFLCSDASAYMNGQNIVIDGGRSII
jgi:NAD(P)-dependent dehydrogenase (short-subunit alcohol dehydrogenase family)